MLDNFLHQNSSLGRNKMSQTCCALLLRIRVFYIPLELNEFAKDLVREWLAARIITNLSRPYLPANEILLDEEKVKFYDSMSN